MQHQTNLLYRRYMIKSLFGLFILVLLLATAKIVFANVLLAGYQVDFLGAESNPDGASTWYYAVSGETGDNDDFTQSNSKFADDQNHDLSHWALEIETCGEIVAPVETYTTITDHASCSGVYDCAVANYTVETGLDPTTGVSSIKFEAIDGGDDDDDESGYWTHIFAITLDNVSIGHTKAVSVAVKAGQNVEVGSITGGGAACVPPGSIGDLVWHDTDEDGLKDSGDSGIPNTTINLLEEASSSVSFHGKASTMHLRATTDIRLSSDLTVPAPVDQTLDFGFNAPPTAITLSTVEVSSASENRLVVSVILILAGITIAHLLYLYAKFDETDGQALTSFSFRKSNWIE